MTSDCMCAPIEYVERNCKVCTKPLKVHACPADATVLCDAHWDPPQALDYNFRAKDYDSRDMQWELYVDGRFREREVYTAASKAASLEAAQERDIMLEIGGLVSVFFHMCAAFSTDRLISIYGTGTYDPLQDSQYWALWAKFLT